MVNQSTINRPNCLINDPLEFDTIISIQNIEYKYQYNNIDIKYLIAFPA